MWLTRSAIHRPLYTLLAIGLLLGMGLYSWTKMGVDLFPKLDYPFVSVTTVYPGAGPEAVDTLVTKKIEEAIDHIVRTKVNAGQLDEAPLTLQQIEQVKAAFLIVLSGMYHNRIDYPASSGGISAAWQPPAIAR